VKEFLQNDMNAKNLSDGVINLLKKGEKDILMKKYQKLINKLKNDQNPYDSAARYIYD
jgi:lipid A disaccharide synthetase